MSAEHPVLESYEEWDLAMEEANEALSRNHRSLEAYIIESHGSKEARVLVDLLQWAMENYNIPDRIVETFIDDAREKYESKFGRD